MTRNKVVLWVQAALCVALAAVLAAGAVGIYREGSERKAQDPAASVYTVEAIGAAMRPAVPLLVATVAATIAGVALGARDERADRAVEDAEISRDLACVRVSEPSEPMLAEASLQKRLRLVRTAGAVLLLVPAAVYLFDAGNFTRGDAEGLELMIAGVATHVFVWVLAAVVLYAVCTIALERSMARETEAARVRAKEERQAGKAGPKAAPTMGATPPAHARVVRICVLAVSVVLIAGGILGGGMMDVLVKAINICTECIGLG